MQPSRTATVTVEHATIGAELQLIEYGIAWDPTTYTNNRKLVETIQPVKLTADSFEQLLEK